MSHGRKVAAGPLEDDGTLVWETSRHLVKV